VVDARWHDDDAGRRLLWVTPAALLVTALALGAFLHLLTALPERPPPPPAIQAQVIELPAPAPPAPPQPAPPPPAPEPPPPPRAEPPPKPEPPPPPKLAVPKPAPKPPPPRPTPPPPVAQPAPPTAAPPTPAPPPQAAPAPPVAAPSGGHMSARAIYKPMPAIPEALRRRDIDLVAVARFHVAPDGSAQVELIQGTFEPTLNRALLDALKTWRFFPALDDGKPVAETFDIRLPISVR
jgi:protein TonB